MGECRTCEERGREHCPRHERAAAFHSQITTEGVPEVLGDD